MPIMICLIDATGAVSIGAAAAAAGDAVRVVRAAAMTKPTPLTNSSTLTRNNQFTMRIDPLYEITADSFRLKAQSYNTGSRINVNAVELTRPPMTTDASGRCTSAPVDV